ncbi:MAG: hypothetical protein HY962_04285 [Ignavibacteriae bacterium]|nr:hypothetical protein [Ignavibacteriota bacterium]
MKLHQHHNALSTLLLVTQLLLVVVTIPHFHLAALHRTEYRALPSSGQEAAHASSVCSVCVLRSDAQADGIESAHTCRMFVSVGSSSTPVRDRILHADAHSIFLRGPPSA